MTGAMPSINGKKQIQINAFNKWEKANPDAPELKKSVARVTTGLKAS